MSKRRPSRLVWRIYLYSVAFVILPAIAIFYLKAALSEPPWKKNFERTGRYVVEHVYDEWKTIDQASSERSKQVFPTPELDRVEKVLGGSVVLYAPSGFPLTHSSSVARAETLSAAEVARLARGEAITRTDGDTRMVAAPIINSAGQLEAYGIFSAARPKSPSEFLLLTLMVVLCATGVASFLLARSFTRPLRSLATSAERIGAGDLSARTNLDRKDEFGAVARAFDDMAGRVAQLLRTQKELLANVSHELRTPLSRIRVALDIAAEGDADGARELLGEIQLDLAELERLIDDIMTAARLDFGTGQASPAGPPLRLERVAAGALIDRAAARFSTIHPERRLTVEAEELPQIEADAALLRRAIDNLLDNAAKYSEGSQPIVLRAKKTGEDLVVEVVDHGAGIDPADLPHLFTPFFRGDRSRARGTGGVGLGLALVKRIVDAHGGKIGIASAEGQTTARVVVPLRG